MQDQIQIDELRALGYTIKVNLLGYDIWYKGVWRFSAATNKAIPMEAWWQQAFIKCWDDIKKGMK